MTQNGKLIMVSITCSIKRAKKFFFNILNVSHIYFYRNRNRFRDFILINHDPGPGQKIVNVVLPINSLLSIFKYV